ncbi:MAG: DUF3137 domain-containing protein [Campylobacterales bacterium]|nr:DUF3137 domain-containing protein [Campylobacterales bacterium]
MLASFLDHYYASMKEELSFLEAKRLETCARVKSSGVYWAIGALFVALVLANTFFQEDHLVAFALGTAFGGIGYTVHFRSTTQMFHRLFKEHVIGHMVRHMGLSYDPKGYIPPHLFRQAQWFTQDYDAYTGDDLVLGEIEGVNVTWSDVKVTYTTRNAKGKTTRHTLFEGIFFVAPFPKHLRSSTWVLPDLAQKVLGDFGTLVQGFDARGGLVKMDNPAFERAFVVLSNDQIEARYLLSPVLMEHLLALKNQANVPLHVSFIDGKIFLGLAYGKPSFEPSLFRSLETFSTLKEHGHLLGVLYGVVGLLGLEKKG